MSGKTHFSLDVRDAELGDPFAEAPPSVLPRSQKRKSSMGFRAPSRGLDGPSPHQLHYRWMTGDTMVGTTGDEPGVDVRSWRDEEAYGHLKGKANIKVSSAGNLSTSCSTPSSFRLG